MTKTNMIPKKQQTNQTGFWHKLGPRTDLAARGRAVYRVEGRQIAVFQTDAGVFAVNNRCPHEGFPLSEGTLQGGCILACNWHGWTFNLETGATIQGRDPVRRYTVECRGDDLWVEILPDDPAEQIARAYTELDEAMAEHDYARIARAVARLEKAGACLEDASVHVLNRSRNSFERGLTHAHAGLADWMALADANADWRAIAYVEAFGHFSWDEVFSPTTQGEAGRADYSPAALSRALEGMDQDRSLALVRGAFHAGKGLADLRPVYIEFIFRHYIGFGHAAIYMMKLDELVARLGTEVEETLALQMARYLCQAAREDLIPEFRGLSAALALCPGQGNIPPASDISGQSVRSLLGLVQACAGDPEALWDRLLGAAALNMLRFDDARQEIVNQPIAQNVGWLDFTHALTFAEASRYFASADPALWYPALLQLACFIGRNVTYLCDADWRKYRLDDPAGFFADAEAALINMDEGDYIFAVHRLKMVRACKALAANASADMAELTVAALNRYLNSPMRKRHPARTVFQARDTVMREG